MNDIIPAGLQGVLAKKNATIDDVANALEQEEKAPVAAPVETPIPKSPALPEVVTDGMSQLLTRIEELSLPSRQRKLTVPEKAAITAVLQDLRTVIAAFTSTKNQIKVALFNHFDAVAAELGLIDEDTPRTKEGWAVLPDKESGAVEGLAYKATREVTPSKVSLTEEGLKALADEGAITHKDYLEMTKSVRQVDDDATLAWIRKHPKKAQELRRAMTRSAPVAKLEFRPNN